MLQLHHSMKLDASETNHQELSQVDLRNSQLILWSENVMRELNNWDTSILLFNTMWNVSLVVMLEELTVGMGELVGVGTDVVEPGRWMCIESRG